MQTSYILENSFRDFVILDQDTELYEFTKAIKILEYKEQNNLNEGVFGDLLDKVSGAIKKKIKFIQELAELSKQKLSDLLLMFKDKKVFQFFKVIGFSIKKVLEMFKLGFKTFKNIEGIIAKKIAELGGVKYIRKNLHLLDEFFNEHPILKKIGGAAVAGLLIYIWLNMSYGVDLEWSMSWEDMINALMGKFSLADLFASDAGIKMLIYLAAGVLTGVSFPWPGSLMQQISLGLIIGLYRTIKPKGVKIEIPK